jgi:hypothetical protein
LAILGSVSLPEFDWLQEVPKRKKRKSADSNFMEGLDIIFILIFICLRNLKDSLLLNGLIGILLCDEIHKTKVNADKIIKTFLNQVNNYTK